MMNPEKPLEESFPRTRIRSEATPTVKRGNPTTKETKSTLADSRSSSFLLTLNERTSLLGLRLHSLILAGAQGVPVVGIGHDPKIGGFMEEAGVGGFLCHPLYPFECVLERVESALEDGAKVRRRLLESCEGMKERIRDEARRVLDSI